MPFEALKPSYDEVSDSGSCAATAADTSATGSDSISRRACHPATCLMRHLGNFVHLQCFDVPTEWGGVGHLKEIVNSMFTTKWFHNQASTYSQMMHDQRMHHIFTSLLHVSWPCISADLRSRSWRVRCTPSPLPLYLYRYPFL